VERLHILELKGVETEEDARKIEEILKSMEGVFHAEVDLDSEVVEVRYDDSKVTKNNMKDKLAAHGYTLKI